jgi:hypothetical protein
MRFSVGKLFYNMTLPISSQLPALKFDDVLYLSWKAVVFIPIVFMVQLRRRYFPSWYGVWALEGQVMGWHNVLRRVE